MNLLKKSPFDDLGFAVVDHHRKIRTGASEVIYAEGKTPSQTKAIVKNLIDNNTENILITRANKEIYEAIFKISNNAVYHEMCRVITIDFEPVPKKKGVVLVISGGTSDMPVAEEAAITAEHLGNEVLRIYDVGVAGIHRLLARLDDIYTANVIIAVAGMEGALASVVGGLTDKPVIAVPTSVGYGANFGGVSALLCMLNSCASGVSVVNIDNGFGAGYMANTINNLGVDN